MASRPEEPIVAYRIADGRYPLFDGAGAQRRGGRWNSPGKPAIYGALSYAGALLEVLAHGGIGKVPRTQRWIRIEIPKGVTVEESGEVSGWDASDLTASRAFGDRWLDEKRSVALVVPSLVGRPNERNIVINPTHPDFSRLRTSEPAAVIWDSRL